MNTFLKWLSDNWVDVLKWSVALMICMYMISAVQQWVGAIDDARRWQAAYESTAEDLAVVQASYANLKASRDKLESQLLERDAQLLKIAANLSTIKNQITKLGSQNEAVFKLLNAVIPDELWDQIFPRAGANSNTDRESQGSGGISPAIRRPARARRKNGGSVDKLYF